MSDAPIPAPNETLRTTLPDSFDGIRFEIGCVVKYIQEGRKDPAVIALAQKIAELAAGAARQLKRKVNSDTRDLIWLEGIHAWCHANFEHVSNPVRIELLKTPARMIRELGIPEAFSRALWEPIRDQMAASAGKDPAKLKLPTPKITGNSAMAVGQVRMLLRPVLRRGRFLRGLRSPRRLQRGRDGLQGMREDLLYGGGAEEQYDLGEPLVRRMPAAKGHDLDGR